jgi:hypothetical protein
VVFANHSFDTAILPWEQVIGFLDGKKVFAPVAGR